MKPRTIKTLGFIVSTISVMLLGVVSWKAASRDMLLMMCLIGGMAASMIGMALRWASYQVEERRGPEAEVPKLSGRRAKANPR